MSEQEEHFKKFLVNFSIKFHENSPSLPSGTKEKSLKIPDFSISLPEVDTLRPTMDSRRANLSLNWSDVPPRLSTTGTSCLAPDQEPRQENGDAKRRHAAGQHRQRTRGRFRFRVLRRPVILVTLELAHLDVASEADARGAALEVRAVLAQNLRPRALALELPAWLLHQHHLAYPSSRDCSGLRRTPREILSLNRKSKS